MTTFFSISPPPSHRHPTISLSHHHHFSLIAPSLSLTTIFCHHFPLSATSHPPHRLTLSSVSTISRHHLSLPPLSRSRHLSLAYTPISTVPPHHLSPLSQPSLTISCHHLLPSCITATISCHHVSPPPPPPPPFHHQFSRHSLSPPPVSSLSLRHLSLAAVHSFLPSYSLRSLPHPFIGNTVRYAR